MGSNPGLAYNNMYYFQKSVTFLCGKKSKCTSLIMNGFYQDLFYNFTVHTNQKNQLPLGFPIHDIIPVSIAKRSKDLRGLKIPAISNHQNIVLFS